jgi:hypothetical protein
VPIPFLSEHHSPRAPAGGYLGTGGGGGGLLAVIGGGGDGSEVTGVVVGAAGAVGAGIDVVLGMGSWSRWLAQGRHKARHTASEEPEHDRDGQG